MKHMGSCQTVHALCGGWECAVCVRMFVCVWPFQGVTSFLRSMKNTVTGVILMRKEGHVPGKSIGVEVNTFAYDTCNSARMNEER